jgi:plasmid maintenance system antidote protein VapI
MSILNGKLAIDSVTVLHLVRHPGPSAQFWLNLQTRYGPAVAERDHDAGIAASRPSAPSYGIAMGKVQVGRDGHRITGLVPPLS